MFKYIMFAISITTLFGGCARRSWRAIRIPLRGSYNVRTVGFKGAVIGDQLCIPDIHGEYYVVVPQVLENS